MLIGGKNRRKIYFNFLPPKKTILAFFFKVLSGFGAKSLQKYTLSVPFKLISPNFNWRPYRVFPDTVMKP